jgi:hypothetical protein
MRASVSVSQLPDVCGIELYGIPWFWSGGYWLMHQKVPLYWFEGEKDFAAHQDAFNTLVAAGEVPAPFEKKTCFGAVCLAQRPGSCAPLPMQQSIDQADIPSGLTPELKP